MDGYNSGMGTSAGAGCKRSEAAGKRCRLTSYAKRLSELWLLDATMCGWSIPKSSLACGSLSAYSRSSETTMFHCFGSLTSPDVKGSCYKPTAATALARPARAEVPSLAGPNCNTKRHFSATVPREASRNTAQRSGQGTRYGSPDSRLLLHGRGRTVTMAVSCSNLDSAAQGCPRFDIRRLCSQCWIAQQASA